MICIQDMTFTYNEDLTAAGTVPADLNGKKALAGTINLDFANDLCDQSGLDIYTALLEVQ